MPLIKEHRAFDIILKWEGIISDDTNADKVHRFIDNEIPRHHQKLEYDETEIKIRKWVA